MDRVFIVYYVDDADYYDHPEIRIYVGSDEHIARSKLAESRAGNRDFGHFLETWIDGSESSTEEFDPCCMTD